MDGSDWQFLVCECGGEGRGYCYYGEADDEETARDKFHDKTTDGEDRPELPKVGCDVV